MWKWYFIDTINTGGNKLYTADQTCRMAEFLIDNINPTQYAQITNFYTSTELIQEDRYIRYIHLKITGGKGYIIDTQQSWWR